MSQAGLTERIAKVSPRFNPRFAVSSIRSPYRSKSLKQQGSNSMFRRTHGIPYWS